MDMRPKDVPAEIVQAAAGDIKSEALTPDFDLKTRREDSQ